jgi:branched-chain amino acid transport system ATP-binding protein
MSLLELRSLEISYGGINAVKGINITVNKGELVCLIGANGAGKTTTLKAVCGMVPVKSGEILYNDKKITGIPPYKLVQQGISMVPEGRGIFGQLTVEENLLMGAYRRNDKEGIASDIEKYYQIFPRLKERYKQSAGTLSGGEQQMLAIARALMSRPILLLLDEPSMGLAPLMVEKIFSVICDINQQGMTLLLVEQNAKLSLEISDTAYVMESGLITLSDKAKDLLDNPQVRHAYLGE